MKSFAILGLGISGKAILEFLCKKDYEIAAWDDNEESRGKINQKFIKHPNEWADIDYIVTSPGIPKHNPYIQNAFAKGWKVITDIELFFLFAENPYIIGVTGTNGKSTTTSLISYILTKAGIENYACGNIGKSPLEFVEHKNTHFVMELSSYQLDYADQLKTNIAIILNITPDHLERHVDMAGYIKAKERIFENHDQNGKIILNAEDQCCAKISPPKGETIYFSNIHKISNGASIIDDVIYYNETELKIDRSPSLLGKHNEENILASYIAAKIVGVSDDVMYEAIKDFTGLKHRMQIIGTKNGITFVNDSKGTNVASTKYPLHYFKNIYWIAGGLSKEDPVAILNDCQNVKHAFLIGKSAEDFAKALHGKVNYSESGNLEKAFYDALDVIEASGDKKSVLLLSPACASQDQWKNFEERGDCFEELVQKFMNLNR